jgi:hypothetical protein
MPLSNKLVGTTLNVEMTNTCVVAGQRPNKTPIYILEYREARN